MTMATGTRCRMALPPWGMRGAPWRHAAPTDGGRRSRESSRRSPSHDTQAEHRPDQRRSAGSGRPRGWPRRRRQRLRHPGTGRDRGGRAGQPAVFLLPLHDERLLRRLLDDGRLRKLPVDDGHHGLSVDVRRDQRACLDARRCHARLDDGHQHRPRAVHGPAVGQRARTPGQPRPGGPIGQPDPRGRARQRRHAQHHLHHGQRAPSGRRQPRRRPG